MKGQRSGLDMVEICELLIFRDQDDHVNITKPAIKYLRIIFPDFNWTEWEFGYYDDSSIPVAGVCFPEFQQIGVFIDRTKPSEIKATLIHEACHAVLELGRRGSHNRHGKQFNRLLKRGYLRAKEIEKMFEFEPKSQNLGET